MKQGMDSGECLVRFISYEDAVGKVFRPDGGTFCLNSTRYYQQRGYEEPNNQFFDRHENEVRLSKARMGITERSLVSCWVKSNQRRIDWPNWGEVSSERTVAILSTPKKVRVLIQGHLEWFIDLCPGRFEYGNVIYYSEGSPKNNFNSTNRAFFKHEKYRSQEEYRFALRLKPEEFDLTALIFYVEPVEYVDSICVKSAKPEDIRDTEKREKLHHLMSLAGGSRIPIEWCEQFVLNAVGMH